MVTAVRVPTTAGKTEEIMVGEAEMGEVAGETREEDHKIVHKIVMASIR